MTSPRPTGQFSPVTGTLATTTRSGTTTAPKPVPKPTPAPTPGPTLNATQQGAFDLLSATLTSWGLAALIPDLKNFIIAGDTNPDTLSLALSQTQAYKDRFAGNAARAARGLPELTPAQYIATEEQYANILQSYGLPKGFYDQHTDFTNFIGNDISPAELQARAQVAHDQYVAAPDNVKQLWSQYFGTKGDAIAAILDPTVATQIIQDRGQQVALGGAAQQFGYNINQSRAQQYQQSGVTLAKAQQAYAQIAAAAPTDQSIAQRFGTTFDQAAEENSLLLNQAPDTLKRQILYGSEQALFKGGSGADQNSLGVSQSY